MLFYDFEVVKYDWLVVIYDMKAKQKLVVINNPDELESIYKNNKNEIWVGFNNVRYDQYIFKGILCGFDPKKINDYIIVRDLPGWKYSSMFNQIKMINYDVMLTNDRGLKSFEGFMGNDIKESSVPFDIERKLTEDEIEDMVKYCTHDVEQTIEIFLQRKSDFEAHLGLVKVACQNKGLDLTLLSKTQTQLSAIILEAVRREHNDEFDIDFPDTMNIQKYTNVVNWYKDENNHCYSRHVKGKKGAESVQLETIIAGVPHVFAWGGVHGAIPQYSASGYFINMDVASLYPSLMIRYNLHSRNIKDPRKYEEIYKTRLKYKAEKNPLQAPLKLVLNRTYGAMKDKNNALYDPLQANRVCVYGQLLLLDLIEKLEPFAEIIQSNTDGILIKMPVGKNESDWYSLIDDIAFEWEQRTGLKLEFDEYRKIFQKDVNNYIIVDAEGHYKSKGGYVMKLSNLNYDLPIVNKALVDYMVNNVPVEKTIYSCDNLKDFQYVVKVSSKYKYAVKNPTFRDETIIDNGKKKKIKVWNGDGFRLNEKTLRVFASNNSADGGVFKVSARTEKPEKISNTPESCFIFNDNVNGVKCPSKLNKDWYVDFAYKRLKDFGVM